MAAQPPNQISDFEKLFSSFQFYSFFYHLIAFIIFILIFMLLLFLWFLSIVFTFFICCALFTDYCVFLTIFIYHCLVYFDSLC